jgi:hypothetical protein
VLMHASIKLVLVSTVSPDHRLFGSSPTLNRL